MARDLLLVFFSLCFVFSFFLITEPVLLLSFDTESPDSSEVMTNLLDILKENNASATFFITEEFEILNGDIVKRIINEDHEIGVHTKNHPFLPLLSKEKRFDEIINFTIYLENEYNIDVKGFRAPWRAITFKSLNLLFENNLYDASVFEAFNLLYFPRFGKEIFTSSFGVIPLDDYVLLENFNIGKNIYFWLLNNYPSRYKSYSFHPHVIMDYENEFIQLLENTNAKKISHKEYLNR